VEKRKREIIATSDFSEVMDRLGLGLHAFLVGGKISGRVSHKRRRNFKS
jgi:hypothetical protein